jgi:hypothetical protein
MANRTKVTQQKRARERAKQERQQEKTRRREEVKTRKANEPHQAGGDEDPDIAGIIPGQSGKWQSRQPVDSRTTAGNQISAAS